MKTQQEEPVRLVLATEQDQQPLFSPELVRMVKDTAYETLRSFLEKSKAPEAAVALLDDLVLTYGWDVMQAGGRVSWVENQSMTEALGAMSYNIVKLHGSFRTGE